MYDVYTKSRNICVDVLGATLSVTIQKQLFVIVSNLCDLQNQLHPVVSLTQRDTC